MALSVFPVPRCIETTTQVPPFSPELAHSLPVVRAGRQFTGVRHGGAGEALEGGRVGVDAEGDAVGVDLVLESRLVLLVNN